MKTLLFDQNLSPRIIRRIVEIYPHALHTDTVGLRNASDRTVWDFAREHDYVIVSKDADFGELLLLLGKPPKLIWIRRGNCSTNAIAEMLLDNFETVETFMDDPDTGILALY